VVDQRTAPLDVAAGAFVDHAEIGNKSHLTRRPGGAHRRGKTGCSRSSPEIQRLLSARGVVDGQALAERELFTRNSSRSTGPRYRLAIAGLIQEHTMGWFSKTDNGFFLATVFPDTDAARVAKYLGIVHGEAIIGANIFRDMFSSVRDVVGGRAGGYERALSGARDAAVEDMIEAARELGADGVVGVDFDYEVLGETNGMMMVAVSGTAVKMA
jgi:uncharacterized protein YbjQ (UPF0145 family)